MKTMLLFSPHSFVDLITNSSSELFICNTKKTVEAVELVLRRLLDTHNELGGYTYAFDDVFGKIEVAEYSFNYESFPSALTARYEEFHPSPIYYRNWNDRNRHEETDRFKALQAKTNKVQERLKVNEKGLYDKDKEEYSRRWQAFHEERNKIWADWERDGLLAEVALYRHFCKENEIPVPAGLEEALKTVHGHYLNLDEPSWAAFSEYLSWGMVVKKGDIFIPSATDNSIPGEIQDSIESYLGARRYHLG